MTQAELHLENPTRPALIKQGYYLEYFTIGYNSLEGLIAVTAGVIAGSIALVGFGFDSLIEVTSGAVLLWRLHSDVNEARRERVEAISLRIVGACFLLLAIYVSYDSVTSLITRITRETPEESLVGILLAAVSLIVMPLLVRAKRKVARGIASRALMADSKQTELCTYLSAILLGGLLLNALFGWWWADPLAALIMVPIIGREGIEALRGETCCDEGACQ
ncbi:MAG: cation transporter [Pyrinomonadaceae bacterium]